jgi:myo-inositol-1(or 4)-monophosphatase
MNDAEVALSAAQVGAALVRDRFRTPLEIKQKPGEDFATDVDVAAERLIRDLLAQHRPDDIVVGEELGGDRSAAARTWLVDPLCGTVNFASGLPLVATNVALVVDGVLVLGASADPIHAQTYWTDGSTAWRHELDDTDTVLRPDATHGKVALDSEMSASSTASLLADDAFHDAFRPMMLSTSLASAWVADGRLAAYLSEGSIDGSVHYAAGVAVARAAGCVVTNLAGDDIAPGPGGLIVAADGATHAALLAVLRR